MEEFDAIVLAGGTNRRLGGVDKAGIEVGGTTLLDHAVRAVAEAGAASITVVGPPRVIGPLPSGAPAVTFTVEDPPRGGPVAAIRAGLGRTGQPVVVVLACDMPFVGPTDVAGLVNARDGRQAAMLVDPSGHRQFLAAAYERLALVAAIDGVGTTDNASMRALTHDLTVAEVLADAETTWDCDTWEDVERSKELAEEQ